MIQHEIPQKVSADPAYKNAQLNSDKENARIEHDKALIRAMTALINDDTRNSSSSSQTIPTSSVGCRMPMFAATYLREEAA